MRDGGRPLDASARDDDGDTTEAGASDSADAATPDASVANDGPALDQGAPDGASRDAASDGAATPDGATLDGATRDAGVETGYDASAVDAGPDLVVPVVDSGPPLGQWQRWYGNDFGDWTPTRVRIAPDGSIVLVGFVTNPADGRVEGAYAVLDGNGAPRMGRRYASPGRELRLRDVRPLADGGAVVVGYDGHTYDESDAVIARLAPDGAVRWARALRSSGVHDSFDGVAVLADGSVVAAGTSAGFDAAAVQSEVLLAWFSPDGVALAARAVGAARNEYGRSVVVLGDGSVVVAAETASFVAPGSGSSETLLVQLTPLGASVAWARTFAANNVRVAQLERGRDGRLLVAQNDQYPTTSDYPFAYLDVAPDGATHTHVYWTDSGDSGAAVVEATDGSRLAVGGQGVLGLERFSRAGARVAGSYMQPRASIFAAGGAATADNGLVAAAFNPLSHQLWLTRANAALAIGGCNGSFSTTRTFTSTLRTAAPAVHATAVLATAPIGATALGVTPMAVTASLACSAP